MMIIFLSISKINLQKIIIFMRQ